MRRYVLVIPFLAATAMGQWSDPHIRVAMRDGRELVFDVVTGHEVAVIVEFRDPPLCLINGRSGKSAVADYRATFARFRQDVASTLNKNRSGKQAIEPDIRYEYYEAFNGVSLTIPRSAIPLIRQLTYVKVVHLDTPVHALSVSPSDNITKIGADRVWSTFGTLGKGIVVAIIDTGIDYNHPALGGGFGAGFRVIGGYDFVNQDNDPMDDNQHGTHVAGIVAGNSDDLVGVAPEASLLAYKVLDAYGGGMQSDIIAAIERSVDPNGDGDLRDHADIANLSLGGPGNPDDALSIAVDQATAAGVVFCVAAGNSGSAFHTVSSPGDARSAITVGATDNTDRIALFSSRGPNAKNAAIKPDILAPGVAVRSSIPGGKYAVLSGTSMATPHVAGVVALVKSLHHDWTPAQIKSAIVNSSALLGYEIMIQGGGRVDALRSAGTALLVEPSSISLGLDSPQQQTWSQTATLHLTNLGSQSAAYRLTATIGNGVVLTTTPSSVNLAPGGSTDIAVSFTITNATVGAGRGSLSFGGSIFITRSGDTGVEALHVPWAAVNANRTSITYDKSFPAAIWIDRFGATATEAIPITETELEAFLRPGAYDLLLYWAEVDEQSLSSNLQFKDLRLYYRDSQNVSADTTFAFLTSDASHTVAFDGRDEYGRPVVGSDFSGYASTARLVFPPGGAIASLRLPILPVRTWHTEDITEKLLFEELQYNRQAHSFYLLQDSASNGLHADTTVTAGGSALKRANVSVGVLPASYGDQRVIMRERPIVPPDDFADALSLGVRVDSSLFNVTLFLSPDVDPNYSLGASFDSITDGATAFSSPMMRIVNDRIISSNTEQQPPWSYTGDTFIFGIGLQFPLQTFSVGSSALKLNIFTDLIGELGDLRLHDRASTITTVYAADGSVQTRGSRYPTALDLTHLGAFKIEAIDDGILVPGVSRKSTATMTLDSTRADYYPPTFTTMMLFDPSGQIASQLHPHGGGSLVFAAADYVYPARTYQPIRAESTKVQYRFSGSPEWKPLAVTQIAEDVGTGSVPGAGILFRVDLAQVADVDRALVDMKFDIEDTSGNTTSYTMEPAFSVERETRTGRAPGRR